MRIVVDRSRCSGIGICESITDKYFEVGDDGAVNLLEEHPDDADVEAVEEAVMSCPVQALALNKEQR